MSHHVMWRDEVRALSIALRGESIVDMLAGLRGEGHPAIWYLLLRSAHTVFGRVEVLPGVAFVTALATVTLVIFRSPFPRALVLILLTGHQFLFAFSVLARNYGICALVMFAIAACYQSQRNRGIRLGLLLFLLANTNLLAAVMVGGFLLFWLMDVVDETGPRWTPLLRTYLANAAIAIAGVLVCALTVFPTYNDAATHRLSGIELLIRLASAILNPGGTALGELVRFDEIYGLAALALGPVASLLLFSATLGLLPRRPAFVAALATLLLTSLFHAIGANGAYRHATIWLCFCISLYWICWKDVVEGALASASILQQRLALVGRVAFALLLGVQAVGGLKHLDASMVRHHSRSRSAELGQLIAERSDLANAIIIAEPDYLVEPLPYYIPNRTYLIRGQRFGDVVRFTRSEQLDTDLGDVLRAGNELKRKFHSPVVILLARGPDRIKPGKVYREAYNWTFRASGDQIRNFLDNTTMVHRFGPVTTDETFDVYLLNDNGEHLTTLSKGN
jgi:hypothetical protein